MRRIVFLSMVLGLLLCAQWVAWWAANGVSASSGPIRVHEIAFFYKTDEKARFLELKNRWQSRHRGELPLSVAGELAQAAFNEASVETPFTQWLYHGGAAPQVFSSKIHLYNTSRQALLNTPLHVTVRAKVAELRVNPEIQMTDYAHLERTGRWETIHQETLNIAALAPDEDLRVEVMRFNLLGFLAKQAHRWPVELEVQVESPAMGVHKQVLRLTPDHFAVPAIY